MRVNTSIDFYDGPETKTSVMLGNFLENQQKILKSYNKSVENFPIDSNFLPLESSEEKEAMLNSLKQKFKIILNVDYTVYAIGITKKDLLHIKKASKEEVIIKGRSIINYFYTKLKSQEVIFLAFKKNHESKVNLVTFDKSFLI